MTPPNNDDSFVEQANLLGKIGHLFQRNEGLADGAPTGEAFLSSALVGEKPGDQVDQYRLTRKLGEGGFGVVFEAEQHSPVKRLVALKIIKAGMDTREVIVRFEAERQTQAMLAHPNIAQVFDAGATKSGRPYFVMELIKGVSITQYCDEYRFGVRERLKLLSAVCLAVHHAHQKGVIHRDLKPSNILIVEQDGRPVPKIIDFGIAKATCPERALHSFLTLGQRIIGTPAYMSPEQADAEGADIDVRTDVYSLGVIAFELLTGQVPFRAPGSEINVSGEEVLRRIREDPVPKPSTQLVSLPEKERTTIMTTRALTPEMLGRQIRGDLDWVILKALAKETDRRYDSCQAFATDLENYLEHRPVSAVAPSSWDRFRKLARRNKGAFAAVSIIIATLAIATVISVQQAVRAKRAEQAASIEAHLATSVSEFLYRDILEQANPLVSDRNITLREVLDRGVEKIDARFHDQPLVLSQLKWIIGRTYTGLSEYERAESLLANSVEIQTRLRGVHDERTMDAMESLGWLYGLQGRLEEAERQHRQVLELRRQNLGDKSLGVVASMNQLGEVLKKRGDLDAARRCAEEAVSTATEIMGENDDLRIAALVSLGQIQTKQRQVDQAERTFKEIMKLRPTAEPGDAMALGALSGLGNLYSDHGRPQEAEPFQQQALAMQRKVFGETSPNTHNALHNLAVTTFHLGRTQEALAMAREAADGSREKLGASHPHTLKFMGTTAFLAVESGDTTTAEKLWTEALEAQLDTLGGEHFETLRTALNLAQFYQEQGRPNEAKEHYLSCLERMPTQRELLDAFEDHVFLSAIAPLAPDAEFHPISFRYTVERPSAEWIVRDFDDSVWDSGPAPFGNRAQEKRSDWNTPEIWLRRDFDAEGTLEGELVLRVFHDDDITVYLNGVLAYEKTGTSRGNYQAVPCIAAANSALRVGKNTLAVHCANTGGDRQVVDVGLFVDSQSTEQQWIDVLSQLIERKPDIPSWHGRRAEALGRLAQWSAFEEDITKILQLDPTEYLGFVAELPLSKDEQASIVKRQRDARDALEDRNASAVWDADRVVRIIPGGSDWSYLDNGEFAGDDWQQESHDDDHWSAGPAPLGYGESDLRTELRSGSDEERHATTYFRHPFTAQPQDIQALKLRVRWDDGVAVYLNGHEVYRENLDPNATFSDFSSGKVGGAEETAYHVVLVDPSLLKSGANLIAVEIHQCDVTSSDLVFDLEMESLRKELR